MEGHLAKGGNIELVSRNNNMLPSTSSPETPKLVGAFYSTIPLDQGVLATAQLKHETGFGKQSFDPGHRLSTGLRRNKTYVFGWML